MMNVKDVTSSGATGLAGLGRRANTPKEAADQFQEVLVKQLVSSMTAGLFKTNLAGEDGPGWMEGYADTQRDMLTDVLAKHLSESGAIKLSDLLMRKWAQQGSIDLPVDASATDDV